MELRWQTVADDVDAATIASLTAFRQQLLFATLQIEHTPSGAEIRDKVEEIVDDDVSDGRLYPNLNELNERDLLEKEQHELDNRSHRYDIPPEITTAVENYLDEIEC